MGFPGLLTFVSSCRPIIPQEVFYPISFKVFQFGLQGDFKGFDSYLGLSVGLRVCWRRVIVFNPEFGTEISEFSVVELFSVV